VTHPIYTSDEALTRDTFMALLNALSYPGSVQTLPTDAAFAAIADTLLDIETAYYTPADDLHAHFSRNGARASEPERAAYHFYRDGLDETALATIKQATIGTLMYPDEGATLIITCTLGQGQTLTLSGPGIPAGTTQTVQLDGIPAAFWDLRAAANRYPRGWDVYFVDGVQVVGLPRTTRVDRT
jgi:alpha-D-ribose 1-methylphosphonate 5-triphosphate synthase subunit PhnH